MIRYVYKVNKSTQIIFGFIGTIYGSYSTIEYYPKNWYDNLLNSYNNVVNVLKSKKNRNGWKKLLKHKKK